MRQLLVLVVVGSLLACGSRRPVDGDPVASGSAREASGEVRMAAEVEALLGAAAGDFRRQQSPRPVRFRGVRSGYLVIAGGARQYRLCGEYSPASDDEGATWIPFATIQTSPYEQWLGGHAQAYCREPGMRWDDGDLSATLLARFNASR